MHSVNNDRAPCRRHLLWSPQRRAHSPTHPRRGSDVKTGGALHALRRMWKGFLLTETFWGEQGWLESGSQRPGSRDWLGFYCGGAGARVKIPSMAWGWCRAFLLHQSRSTGLPDQAGRTWSRGKGDGHGWRVVHSQIASMGSDSFLQC